MTDRYCLALCISLLLGLVVSAYAEANEEYEDLTRSLTMTCEYSDYPTFQHESVSIACTTDGKGKPASVKKFKRGGTQRESEVFIVRPGEFCECIYPSGTRVRVKVGEGHELPIGYCKSDPEVFMSLWVNERKIVSRLQFSGCRYWEDGHPAVSFDISRSHDRVSVKKCHTAVRRSDDLAPMSDDTEKKASDPLAVCVDFPDVSEYPRDLVEYPPEGRKTSKAGDIETLYGSGPVCQAVLEELKRNFCLSNLPVQSKTGLSRPNWSETSVELPKGIGGSQESIFDFNNDGKLDRVFSRDFYWGNMYGSVLLVQPGRSSSKLMVSASPMDSTSIYLPFQMDKVRRNIDEYPPFSKDNEDAGFSMKGRNDTNEIYFKGIYSFVEPFNLDGTNFIVVRTSVLDGRDLVAVLKPLPDGRFEKIGLFRRVPENF